MRVLLLGATGLVGRRLAEVLGKAGHELVLGVRDRAKAPDGAEVVEVDFARDHDAADWLPRLEGIDAVVNAVGILAEAPGQDFESIHVRAPVALFEACSRRRVGRVVQVSAIGADAGAASGYHRSKRRADQALLASGVSAVVVQPSLVFSPEGASTGLFAALAALPVVPVPGNGKQCVQPVHLDDVCAVLRACLEHPAPPPRVEVAGPRPLELREYLLQLRSLMGLGGAPVVPLPRPVVRLGSRMGGLLPGPPVDPETLDMLERGACGDPGEMTRLLGRAPREVAAFDPGHAMEPVGLSARLGWLLPLMRVALAVMWIVTGVVSLGVYPVEDSLELLARTGLHGGLALASLYVAAGLDLAFGIGTLAMRRRLWLYRGQLLLIAGYTVIITLRLPEFWLHPYGPILKNLPVIALIIALHELDRGRRWST